jgi:hypothetical protein
MLSVMVQIQILGLSVPHGLNVPAGFGFPLFLLVSLILWFAFLALIGAFKK